MAGVTSPNTLSATESARKIREGVLSSVDLTQGCLDRIEETDPAIRAWAHLDAEHALAQARELDAIRQAGRALGALHGVPVGIKDIVDTRDFPTECGSPIHAGRRPDRDAAVIDRLREAGAVILGKTVTTEFAFLHPSITRNPHDPDASPGGSSSGSAAAVAACHVPLAIGTQTNGSVIRPASFCGTYGFKPTRGMISRRGVLRTSKSLDQIGVFARTLEDAALLADALAGYDPADELSFARPRPDMSAGARAEVPIEPDFAWFDLPFADRLADDAMAGLDEVMNALEGRVERLPAPASFTGLVEAQRIIHQYEFCQHMDKTLRDHADQISATLQPIVASGRAISDEQADDARATMAMAVDHFDSFFKDFDAIITPSSAGEAPRFADGTGDPVFCTLWTLCGLPALSLPLLVGDRGLPVGVQLVGAAEQDDRLLRTANWMVLQLDSDRTAG